MTKKIPKKTSQPNLKIDYSKAEVVFANFSEIKSFGEEVQVFLGIREYKNNNNVLMTHRLMMTLPHFMKFANIINKTANIIMEEIQAIQKEEDV